MHTTHTPWLTQLEDRSPYEFSGHTEADVVIVGAGIAGVSTVYFTLKHTDATVLLVDAGRIAHGATGRNAGQLVSYFERPFTDIARAFGTEMAMQGQLAVESAWGMIEDILEQCSMKTPLHMCAGYAGFSTIEQIVQHLEELDMRAKAGLDHEPLLLKIDPALADALPEHLKQYVMQVPHGVILNALETDDTDFLAAQKTRKGCMNSALFCEELVAWMLHAYPDRLQVIEHLPVTTLVLQKEKAIVKTESHILEGRHVILCTNGFENFTIENNAGTPVDPSFHETVKGRIGYMAAYLDEPNQVPIAISYYRSEVSSGPYHYLTRRPYDQDPQNPQSLICVGGPERFLPDRAQYDPQLPFPADIEEELDREIRYAYRDLPPYASRPFLWQGLMGYTPNSIRRIGYEPANHVLLYNLGCNGVGILPSVYGGKRIAQLLAGIQLPPSIFDPELGHL